MERSEGSGLEFGAMKPLHLILPLLLLVGCKPAADTGKPSAESKGKPQVYTANYPLAYFAQRLGGDAVEVKFPAPADEDPAFWQPDEATVAAYQGADLILMNGATYSKWAEKVTLPQSKMVDTSAAFRDKLIQTANAVTHSHGPAGEHSHGGTAFTTWIDLQQAIAQAQAVQEAFAKKWPEQSVKFQGSFEALKKELQDLDDRLVAVGKRMAGAPIMGSHPIYQYWARRYQVNLKDVLWEPETVPDEKAMNELQVILGTHPAKWMVWEGEPAKESVEKIQALGLASVVFDPCGNKPEAGDFLSVMKSNVEAMEKAFP